MAAIGDLIRDRGILTALRDPGVRLILVIGASDAGKTTLVEAMARDLSRRGAVGLVDLDMGQSRLGPPATVAWGLVEGGFPGWEAVRVEGFHFTGSFSPAGHLLPSLVGAKRMTDAALARSAKVIVDTTGLVDGPEGVALKQHKIDLLSPGLVVALERSGELGPILRGFRAGGPPRLVRVPVPEGARSRSPEKRARYRADRLAAYFAAAKDREVPLERIGVRHARPLPGPAPGDLRGRLVSLRDDGNRDMALGVVMEARSGGTTLLVRTPLPEGVPVSALVIGTAGIDGEDLLR